MSKKFRFKSHKNKKINFIDETVTDDCFKYIQNYRVEIFSDNTMLIEGCKKILDYNSDYIKLKLEKTSLIIFGKNFQVITFEDKQIKLSGTIISLEFCK